MLSDLFKTRPLLGVVLSSPNASATTLASASNQNRRLAPQGWMQPVEESLAQALTSKPLVGIERLWKEMRGLEAKQPIPLGANAWETWSLIAGIAEPCPPTWID